MEHIRNFTIVGHIDHGKTTLTDRFLELTRTIPDRQMRRLYLDQMELERERGITIKAKTIRMNYELRMTNNDLQTTSYVLNLIDTPGHVDFSYEVSRALLACEGAVLIVDATQGIQAQTVAHFWRCASQKVKMIPVVNKIDLPNAQTEATRTAMAEVFGFKPAGVISLSAKTGQGVPQLLEAVIRRVPPPQGEPDQPFQALVFDSSYNPHQGVTAIVRLFAGRVSAGETIFLLGSQTKARVLEVGYFEAGPRSVAQIQVGEVGYVMTDLKQIKNCRVGDTMTKFQTPNSKLQTESLPGFQPPKPAVFADFYPLNPDDFLRLAEALSRLALTDASLNFYQIGSPSLGRGFRCGFLGLLHVEIVAERLKREFDLELLITEPQVEYRLWDKDKLIEVKKPSDLPFDRGEVEEPVVKLTVYSPETYLSLVMKLLEQHRYQLFEMRQLGNLQKMSQIVLIGKMPLRELIRGFYGELKSVSSGYASFEYEVSDWQKIKAARLKVKLNNQEIEPLTKIVPEDQAQTVARRLAENLKKVVPKHQFSVAIQIAIGGKIMARETIPSLRKDVTAPLYGGDVTRKMKLLEKQKRGKTRLKRFGKVSLSQEVFWQLSKS